MRSAHPTRRLERRRVPDLRNPTLAGRNELVVVGAETHPGDLIAVSVYQAEDLPSGCGFPELDSSVVAGGCESSTVGAERHNLDGVGMPSNVKNLPAIRYVEDDHVGSLRTGQSLAVGIKSHAEDVVE